MGKSDHSIYIIGSGVSGLVAAITLEKAGYKPVILESTNHIGGRLHTIKGENNTILDLGFQVMLDAYPAVTKFLDLEKLDLIKFAPGSIVYKDGKKSTIGDASRDKSFLWATIMASVGSLKDKWLVFTLSRKLKNKELTTIFSETETTTIDYLRDYGFSEIIISRFFKPFYTGIFLEDKLETSSRMFEFVFKMFAQGSATIPAAGIQAIPSQLAAQLKTDLRVNTAVQSITGNEISLKNGEILNADKIIIATTASNLVTNLPDESYEWKSVSTLYFKTSHAGYGKPIIGLVSDENTLINNYHFLHDVFNDHAAVVIVSVVTSNNLTDDELIKQVAIELKKYADVDTSDCIKLMHIDKALPVLSGLNYAMMPSETKLTEAIYLAGDHLSNGSLNAAMLNGEAAAQQVISSIENTVIV